MKHTQGEWELLRQGHELHGEGGHEIVAVIKGVPVSICELPIESHNSEAGNPDGYHLGEAESIANGYLLAAAPKMFTTLKKVHAQLIDWGKRNGMDFRLISSVQDAIAEAEPGWRP